MLSSGLSVEGIGHGLPLHSAGSFPSFLAASHHHHMTFMDPFLKSDLRTTTTVPPVPEFIRPLPKPMGLSTKHFSSNALASSGGGGNSRAVSRSLLGKYHDPGGQGGPVNLSQSSSSSTSSSKETPSSSPSHSPANGGGGGSESPQSQQTNFRNMYSAPGLFVPPPPPTISMYPPMQGPFASLYPGHYIPLQLSREQATSLAPSSATISPLEQFPNSQPSPNSPATAYSPPTLSSPSPKSLPPPAPSSKELKRPPSFKVSSINPSGKEGSLKHRILTSRAPKRSHAVSEAAVSTPVAVPSSIAATPVAVPHSAGAPTTATLPFGQNNNHAAPNFSRGSLIQLANGELKRVEDMKAEDFINSAKNSSELCLDPSTVVRIDESTLSRKGTTILTLSHGDSRTEVSHRNFILYNLISPSSLIPHNFLLIPLPHPSNRLKVLFINQ